MKKKVNVLAVACVFATACVLMSANSHAGITEDFEGMSLGSVNGQDGWSATNSNIDQEVADTGSGNQALRISNAYTSGSFGDQVFTPHSGMVAGEGAPFDRYYASFDFWSVTTAFQNGLSVTVSPDNGSGGRQSFIDIEDSAGGIDLLFYDYDDSIDGFVGTYVATDLGFDAIHNLAFEILFEDGEDNDVVNIYLDNNLIHTGRSWEQFYVNHQPGNVPVTVDTLLFRQSGTAAPGVTGGGYYFDNFEVTATVVPIPGAAALGLLGLGLVGVGRRFRKRA